MGVVGSDAGGVGGGDVATSGGVVFMSLMVSQVLLLQCSA